MNFTNIQASVEELLDGRSFGSSKHQRWINRVRKDVAMDFANTGFRGLYFLYKEATVTGGGVADQELYSTPCDFIDDLSVFYDEDLLIKADPKLMQTLHHDDDSGTPEWFVMQGGNFKLIPAPDTDGNEIKLIYNGLPDEISSGATEDYFMKRWPDLHIFGMAHYAALYLDDKRAQYYKSMCEAEKQKLKLHNRRYHLKYTKARLQHWSEYTEKQKYFQTDFD